ncbi:MAG TPA: tyrosine-type recombinase/integrase [Candidatus Binatia bacterium]|nr:tyrosine-type recombinase/integrase [Candidatus Binatia bacterium]
MGQQRNVSPATIAAYRDAFRLLLRFAEGHLHRPASALTTDDLNAPLVLAFLDHLERDRHNAIRSRNARLVAVRAFAQYVATEEPTVLPITQRILAIPCKRHQRPVLGYLSREEMQAVLDAPDVTTWSGERDRALFLILYNTGARISEALGLSVGDIPTTGPACITVHGKGRKERTIPLWPRTRDVLTAWIRRHGGMSSDPLFRNRRGERLTRSGAADRLALAVARAAVTSPSLRNRDVSLHTVRHTTAMHLLQSGTDTAVIALWLGHASVVTTHGYLEADLAMKERALARVDPPKAGTRRFKPSEDILAFLDHL